MSSEADLLSYRHASTTDISGLVSGLIQYLSDLWNSGEFQGDNCVFLGNKIPQGANPQDTVGSSNGGTKRTDVSEGP